MPCVGQSFSDYALPKGSKSVSALFDGHLRSLNAISITVNDESGLGLHDEVVAVWPLAGFDKTLHYRASDKLAGRLTRASCSRSYGRRFVLGVVVETGATADVDYSKLKLVSQLCYDEPILTRELLELAEWIRATTDPVENQYWKQ